MNDKQKIAELEAVLTQFLRPVRNIPFSLIIKSMSGHDVLAINRDDVNDAALVKKLTEVAQRSSQLVAEKPIRRNRPNEVGNDIEAYVIDAAKQLGLSAEKPKTKSGIVKTTGYPDVLLGDSSGRPVYLECKIFGQGSALTTMRSFYLSPSDNFKVTVSALHLLIAFGVEREPIPESRDSFYRAVSFKLVDLSALKCDVKYEFNSDNRRLYHEESILAEGPLTGLLSASAPGLG